MLRKRIFQNSTTKLRRKKEIPETKQNMQDHTAPRKSILRLRNINHQKQQTVTETHLFFFI